MSDARPVNRYLVALRRSKEPLGAMLEMATAIDEHITDLLADDPSDDDQRNVPLLFEAKLGASVVVGAIREIVTR